MATTNETYQELNRELINNLDLSKFYNVDRIMSPHTDVSFKGISYLFFTTPVLNIDPSDTKGTASDNIESNRFFKEIKNSMPVILEVLSGNNKYGNFIRLLTNTFEDFSPTDTTSRNKDIGENFDGYKMAVPGTSIESRVGGDFSINYQELKGNPVTNLHKVWFEYMESVRRGLAIPSNNTITKKILDYVSSVYYFLMEPDGETISFWAKYTGVFPTAVPYSSFSYAKGDSGVVKVSIPYSYSYKEELEPSILTDFNKVANPSQGVAKNFFDFIIGNNSLKDIFWNNNEIKNYTQVENKGYTIYNNIIIEKIIDKNVFSTENSIKYKLRFIADEEFKKVNQPVSDDAPILDSNGNPMPEWRSGPTSSPILEYGKDIHGGR
jgi:hypothetical protein